MSRRRMTPWARIYLAAQRGTGVSLRPEDVRALAMDGGLMLRGSMDLETHEEGSDPRGPFAYEDDEPDAALARLTPEPEPEGGRDEYP